MSQFQLVDLDVKYYSGFEKFGCMFTARCNLKFKTKVEVEKHLRYAHGWFK